MGSYRAIEHEEMSQIRSRKFNKGTVRRDRKKLHRRIVQVVTW